MDLHCKLVLTWTIYYRLCIINQSRLRSPNPKRFSVNPTIYNTCIVYKDSLVPIRMLYASFLPFEVLGIKIKI